MLMDRKKYYLAINKNLKLAKGLDYSGKYMCPLCMNIYTEQEAYKLLTEEDVPQNSLGGSRITLTCKECNSTCGHQIDIHLLNAIKSKDQSLFLPNTNRQVLVESGDQYLNASLEVSNIKDIKLIVDTKRNNPQVWKSFNSTILKPFEIVDVLDKPLKTIKRRVEAALIKNAYLLLFVKTGYIFLFDSHYDILRRQIKQPDVFHLPEGLWTVQDLALSDGIYLTQDNKYRGFFVIYTLKYRSSYKVCVLIPTPNVSYLAATKELRKFEAHKAIPLMKLPDLNYLECEESMLKLKNWCYGWDMML